MKVRGFNAIVVITGRLEISPGKAHLINTLRGQSFEYKEPFISIWTECEKTQATQMQLRQRHNGSHKAFSCEQCER